MYMMTQKSVVYINMFSTIWSEAGVLDFITHVLSYILCTRLAKAHHKITIHMSHPLCLFFTVPDFIEAV